MFKTVFKIGKDLNATSSSRIQKHSNNNLIKTKRRTNEDGPEPTESDNHFSSDYTPNFEITKEKVVLLLKMIPREYFIFFPEHKPLRIELEMLAEMNFESQLLHARILQFADQRFVVSKEISRLIQLNHNDYMAGVNRLTNIQSSLQIACSMSLHSRGELKNALCGIRNGGLGILLSFRKMQRLQSSLKQLSLVKTLQQADLWLKERLNSGLYKEAAHCCMIFLRALHSFHNFSCCIDLTSKLLDIQHVITTKLDVFLVILAQDFNPEIYLDVMAAYHSLGKCEAAIEKLVLNFIQNIRQKANHILCDQFNFLSKEKKGSTIELDEIFSTIKAYNDSLSPQAITSTISSLCFEISKVIFVYFDVVSYQERLPSRISEDSFVSQIILNRKLIQGRTLIWKESEKIFDSLLDVVKFEHFSFEILFHIIKVINTFINLGMSFCDSPSSSLVESLRILSLEYFEQFHKLRMDELKIFLENESWELCPLPFNFALEQFNEFSFLQSFNADNSQAIHGKECSTSPLIFLTVEDRRYFLDYFEQLTINPNSLPQDSLPFLLSNEVCNTVSRQSIPQNVILIANTTLITLKCIGRYIQIMMTIKIIAVELFQMLTQLYKYYFYVINMYFADRASFPTERLVTGLHGFDNHQNYYNVKLNTVLSQIVSELNMQHQGMFPNTSTVSCLLSEDILMFGLKLRIIGIESLIFLSEQIHRLRPIIDGIFIQNPYCANKECVSNFYSQYIDISHGLRRPAYCGLAHFTVNYDQILQKMVQTKWDMKELLSHHNPYIDLIIKEFESISYNMDKISLIIPVPFLVRNMLLEECASLTNKLLVEGFANGKKCTHQGRALMLFDFRELVANIEKNCKMKISNKSLVEDYIHAFYLDEEELDKWIQEHREYTSSQLNSLLNCKTSFTKRTTNKLLNLIEKGAPSH